MGVVGGSVVTADDGTAFKAPAQVNTGDRFTINLALANRSENPLEAQIPTSGPSDLPQPGSYGLKCVIELLTFQGREP